MGAVPTPDGQGSQNTSNDPLESSLGGYVSFLQNGQTSLPAPHSNPITKQAASGSKGKNVIDIDNGDEVLKEVAVRWLWTCCFCWNFLKKSICGLEKAS